MDGRRSDALLKEYAEVCGNFKLLTDIRFKLLALLPIATAAAAALRGDIPGANSIPLSAFGLVATIGLLIYNARNDQLYNTLVARAASIERILGLPDGSFANRPRPWLTISILGVKTKIDHGTGVYTIYFASIALWLTGLLAPLVNLIRSQYVGLGFPHVVVASPAVGVNAVALGLAIAITYLCGRSICRQKKQSEDDLQISAARAVEYAKALEFSGVRANTEFLELCRSLAGEDDSSRIEARADYYGQVDKESLGYYLPDGDGIVRGSHFVALLTDMPPSWLFDCASNRRGLIQQSQETPPARSPAQPATWSHPPSPPCARG